VRSVIDSAEEIGPVLVITSRQDKTGGIELQIDDRAIIVHRNVIMRVMALHDE
jgi:hypothetical protein